jgi:hypothetical protein
MDDYIGNVCGRVIQSSGPLRYAIVDGMNVRDNRMPLQDLMQMWPISTRVNKPTTTPRLSSRSKWPRTPRRMMTLQWRTKSDHRFALRRFLDFLGEALREATVF